MEQYLKEKVLDVDKEIISEIVFNTSMTGYLEVLTDPSYAGTGSYHDVSAYWKLWNML